MGIGDFEQAQFDANRDQDAGSGIRSRPRSKQAAKPRRSGAVAKRDTTKATGTSKTKPTTRADASIGARATSAARPRSRASSSVRGRSRPPTRR